ncbi:hypothetical protein C8Q73DRAFT_838591 [Cubamyces lactineus]|nr:hypothetical protein C8Q73DRAFT_838591 [Cubamyces lactineus]
MDQELATRLDFDIFVHEFVKPVTGEPEDVFFDNLFDSVPTNGCESAMYEAFADAINTRAVLSGSLLVATHSPHDNRDATENKAGCGMYSAGSSAVIDRRTDWSTIEVTVECETGYEDDPDALDVVVEEVASYPILSRSRKGLIAQITTTSSLVSKYQLVTHHFTILLLGEYARVAMSDRAGIIYSSQVNYKANPAKLGRVLWCLSHASPEARGHDPSAVRIHRDSPEYDAMVAWKTKILPVDDHAREVFVETLREDYPWYKLTVGCEDGPRDFLVAKPTYVAPELIGRGTHGFVAYNVGDSKRPFVYLKDCWRVVHGPSKQEGEILAYLNSKGVRYIPTLLCHGDVPGQETVAHKIWQRVNASPDKRLIKTNQHYRLVVNEVGKPIYEFSNGKQLVKLITECMFAHKEAYDKAKVIHRDISAGNLLMVPVGKTTKGGTIYRGLLTHWELSKRIDERNLKPRNPDRAGTWQYMSVNALNLPSKEIDVADDLESFLYVLIWCAIRYLPHNCPDVGHFMYYFFDDSETTNYQEYSCGLLKRLAVEAGYLLTSMQKRVVFLREPPRIAVSTAAAPHESAFVAAATPTLDNEPSTPPSTPPAHAPSSALVYSSASSLDIPEKDQHPVHLIVTELLQRFMMYYKLQANTGKHVKPVVIAEDVDELYGLDAAVRFDTGTDEGEAASFSHEMIPAHERGNITKAVNTHRAFGELLMSFPNNKMVGWPENDRLADQLDPAYRPDKEDKTREKRPRHEDKPANSDSKPFRSDTSKT